MKIINKISVLACMLTGCYTSASLAAANSGVQMNLYGGWSNISTNRSNVVFDQYETDTLTGGNHSTSFIPGLGVSYLYSFNPATNKASFIQAIGLGVDFFNDNFDRNGQVYQYQLPEFNNYTYKMQLNSARLLLNGELDFHSLWQVTPFIEGGVGGAYNKLKYDEKAQPGIIGGELDMPSSLTMNFAYDAGAGLKMPVGSQVEVSFRYLYTDPGSAETGTLSDDNVTLDKPIKVDMKSNSWLFGLSYLIP